MALRGIGIDIVDVARFSRLVERGGERFIARWFTVEEAGSYRGTQALAAGFAAKEAVFKALAVDWEGRGVPWAAIGIVGGEVHLGAELATMAEEFGIGRVWVRTTPGSVVATAVAFAELA